MQQCPLGARSGHPAEVCFAPQTDISLVTGRSLVPRQRRATIEETTRCTTMDKQKNNGGRSTLERTVASRGREMQTQIGVEITLKDRRASSSTTPSPDEIDKMIVSYIQSAQDVVHGGATKTGAVTALSKFGVIEDVARLSIVRLYSSGIIGQTCDDRLSWRQADGVLKV